MKNLTMRKIREERSRLYLKISKGRLEALVEIRQGKSVGIMINIMREITMIIRTQCRRNTITNHKSM